MKSSRITSIDALRGIVLFGILLVHTVGLFGFFNIANTFSYFTNVDLFVIKVIGLLFNNRCNLVFSILFGVSFYLILKNPQYSSKKFVWRCIILFVCGLLIKFFYTYDALMWYGLMGIILTLFRHKKENFLLFSFIVTFFLSILLTRFSLGTLIFEESSNRYIVGCTLSDIIGYSVIESIKDYLRIALNGGVFSTLSYFILGYYFAKRGLLENLEKIKGKHLLYIGLLYIVFFVLSVMIDDFRTLLKMMRNLFGGMFYVLCFLSIYYWGNKKCKTHFFKGLEAYGKLGLTNYCMQNILGVVLMALVFIPYKCQFVTILFYSILFYILQMIFSIVWLSYFKYGPFEWCWRCLTNVKYITNYRF